MLTKRQKQTLDYIKSFKGKKGYSPSLEEITKHLGLSSVSTAHHHVKALEDHGYVKKTDNQPRAIDILNEEPMVQISVLGTISAGQPILAVEQKELISVPQTRIGSHPKDFYALKVKGQSMIDENINDGDVVLVRSQETAENGQKIVALINNDEATLKKYYKESDKIRLQPANPNYKPTFIDPRDLRIQGIVTDVIKSGGEVTENLSLFEKKIEKYEKMPVNKIIQGDAIDLLQRLPDESIDLILADPPYNLSKGNHIHFSNNFGLKGFGGDWNKVMENWDSLPLVGYFQFTVKWLKEAKRVLKPTGSVWIFGSYHNIGIINMVMQILGIEIINEIAWYKRNSFPNLAGRRFTASHETLLWGHIARKKREYYFNYKLSKEFSDPSDLLKIRGKQMRTVWDIPNNKERREIKYGKHPTQKPLNICKRIISLCSKQGDVVLAPFAGAGSECVAAKELNRFYLGFELEKQYIEIAEKRLTFTNQQDALFV